MPRSSAARRRSRRTQRRRRRSPRSPKRSPRRRTVRTFRGKITFHLPDQSDVTSEEDMPSDFITVTINKKQVQSLSLNKVVKDTGNKFWIVRSIKDNTVVLQSYVDNEVSEILENTAAKSNSNRPVFPLPSLIQQTSSTESLKPIKPDPCKFFSHRQTEKRCVEGPKWNFFTVGDYQAPTRSAETWRAARHAPCASRIWSARSGARSRARTGCASRAFFAWPITESMRVRCAVTTSGTASPPGASGCLRRSRGAPPSRTTSPRRYPRRRSRTWCGAFRSRASWTTRSARRRSRPATPCRPRERTAPSEKPRATRVSFFLR